VEFVGTGYASSGSIAVPAGVEPGDLLVALIIGGTTVTPALPAGFEQISVAANPSGNGRLLACWKIADGTEANVAGGGTVFAFRNARGIGAIAKIELATVSTAQPIPTLPEVSEGSVIVAGHYSVNHTAVTGAGLSLQRQTSSGINAAIVVSPPLAKLFQAQGGTGGTFVSSGSFAHVTMTIEVLAR
jgi:hypothetical protein